jgi:hypothetical protein
MPKMYEALLREGYSKSSAARITNARARPGDPIVSPHGEGYRKKGILSKGRKRRKIRGILSK